MKQILLSIKILSAFFIISLGLSSCEIINPSEEIPFYLRIDSISFIDSTKVPARPAKAGSQNIKDAWVFVDGLYQGTFELPCIVPVYGADGNHSVTISPGILVSAQNNDRTIYPFFTTFRSTITSLAGQTTAVIPKVSYDPVAVKYPTEAVGQFPEEFEGVGTIFRTATNSKVDTFFRTDDPALVFDGNFSLLLELDASKDYMEIETDKAYSLPISGRPVYMDLNYRTDVDLTIGLYAIKNDGSGTIDEQIITMLPSINEWRRLYLDLTKEVGQNSNCKYRIYFKASHTSGLTTSKVLLDNIRIMYK
jgi:hypothetical protein